MLGRGSANWESSVQALSHAVTRGSVARLRGSVKRCVRVDGWAGLWQSVWMFNRKGGCCDES